MKLTALQKLKQHIVHAVTNNIVYTPEEIEAAFDSLSDGQDDVGDIINEIRSGQCNTNIVADYSRHYSSKSVAAQMLDGSWIGWTYYYGGGKHGEPSEMPWMHTVHDLERTVVIREVVEFTKV